MLSLEALLAHARSRFGSEAPLGLHSLPKRSFAARNEPGFARSMWEYHLQKQMHPVRGNVGCFLWRRFSLTLGHASALKPHWGFIHYRSAASLPGTNRASPGRCGSTISKNRTTRFGVVLFLEAPPGIEPGMRVLQTRALPLGYGAVWSGKRGSNPPPQPWQGCALPNELFPHKKWCLRVDLNHRHRDFQSLALPTELPRHIGDPEGARTPDLQRDRLAY